MSPPSSLSVDGPEHREHEVGAAFDSPAGERLTEPVRLRIDPVGASQRREIPRARDGVQQEPREGDLDTVQVTLQACVERRAPARADCPETARCPAGSWRGTAARYATVVGRNANRSSCRLTLKTARLIVSSGSSDVAAAGSEPGQAQTTTGQHRGSEKVTSPARGGHNRLRRGLRSPSLTGSNLACSASRKLLASTVGAFQSIHPQCPVAPARQVPAAARAFGWRGSRQSWS